MDAISGPSSISSISPGTSNCGRDVDEGEGDGESTTEGIRPCLPCLEGVLVSTERPGEWLGGMLMEGDFGGEG